MRGGCCGDAAALGAALPGRDRAPPAEIVSTRDRACLKALAMPLDGLLDGLEGATCFCLRDLSCSSTRLLRGQKLCTVDFSSTVVLYVIHRLRTPKGHNVDCSKVEAVVKAQIRLIPRCRSHLVLAVRQKRRWISVAWRASG